AYGLLVQTAVPGVPESAKLIPRRPGYQVTERIWSAPMRKLRLVTTMLVVLPLSTFVVACDSGEDTDLRTALEREALERELDLALQPDTTSEPELADVAIEDVVPEPEPPPPPARATPPARQSTPRQT